MNVSSLLPFRQPHAKKKEVHFRKKEVKYFVSKSLPFGEQSAPACSMQAGRAGFCQLEKCPLREEEESCCTLGI